MTTNSISTSFSSSSENRHPALQAASRNLYSNITEKVSKLNEIIIKPYDGPGYTNVPAITNILYIPIDLVQTIYAALKANVLHDKEGKLDAWLRLTGMPINVISSILSAIATVYKVIAFFRVCKISYLIFSKLSVIPGTILCIIEGVFESTGAYRNWHFLKAMNDKNLDELSLVKKNISFLKTKYFSLSPEKKALIETLVRKKHHGLSPEEAQAKKEEIATKMLTVQQTDLARRIRPFLVKEVEENIDALEQGLLSYDHKERQSALARGKELLKDVKVQAQKKLAVHIVGLIAITLTTIGLPLFFVSCPYIVLFLLIFIGGILAMVRYAMASGLLDHKGWDMDYKNCLPQFIRKRFFDRPTFQENRLTSEEISAFLSNPKFRPFASPLVLSDRHVAILPPEHSPLFKKRSTEKQLAACQEKEGLTFSRQRPF